MAFLNLLFPSEDAESAYSIDYEALYAEGVRGIIFDIDNTLVPHGLPADMKSRDLFRRLHAVGLKTCLISNNDGPRVRPFADAVHSDYMPDAGKPLKRGYKAAMGLMRTDRTRYRAAPE